MNKIRRVALGFGLAALMVAGVACGNGETRASPPEAEDQSTVGPSGSLGADTPPFIQAGAPPANVTYEGAVYHINPLSADEAANLNKDDLEFVGVSTKGLDIYKLKGGEEGYLYTPDPEQSFLNEDGTTITIEAEWVRWKIGPKNLVENSIKIAPTTSGVALTEGKFRDLITVEDVEKRLSTKISLKTELRDFKEMAGRADSSQVEKMDSWYGITIEAADGGPGMTFSVIDFDSKSSAEDHFVAVMFETSVLRQMTPPLGDISGQAEVNAEGIGSMLVFTSGDKVVSMHTMQSEGQLPLLSLEDLEELAALALSRL